MTQEYQAVGFDLRDGEIRRELDGTFALLINSVFFTFRVQSVYNPRTICVQSAYIRVQGIGASCCDGEKSKNELQASYRPKKLTI